MSRDHHDTAAGSGPGTGPDPLDDDRRSRNDEALRILDDDRGAGSDQRKWMLLAAAAMVLLSIGCGCSGMLLLWLSRF